MELKVYADRLSQPSRAILIFCKANKIDFEEVKVELVKRQHRTPEFKEINPRGQVPAIVFDGKFKLSERYSSDIYKRAEVHSILDWHHSNLRRGSTGFVMNTTLAPLLGHPLNPQAAAKCEKVLSSSLSHIESAWLKESGQFLLGSNEPSIADLSLVCEIMELEVADETDRSRILGPYKKVQQWIEATKNATNPHFDEVHEILFRAKPKL